MKFEFGFERLLHHKSQLENIARREWLEAKAIADKSMQELDQMFKQIDQARASAGELQRKGNVGAAGPALSQIGDFIEGQKLRIERHRLKLRELLAEVERTLGLLVEAAKERKTLEKLKERRLEEYKLRRKKLELKAVDELVVTRFRRNEG